LDLQVVYMSKQVLRNALGFQSDALPRYLFKAAGPIPMLKHTICVSASQETFLFLSLNAPQVLVLHNASCNPALAAGTVHD